MVSVLKKKLNNKKGFTLAELLAVVAIIAVLVAIAIPVFTAATNKAQDAVHVANCRAAFAEAMVAHIGGEDVNEKKITYDGDDGTYTVEVSDNKLTVTCDKNLLAESKFGKAGDTIQVEGSLESHLS